jgi:hypothetical protein
MLEMDLEEQFGSGIRTRKKEMEGPTDDAGSGEINRAHDSSNRGCEHTVE